MKAQARTWLWWPSLDSSIEQYCKSCLPCLQTRQDPPRTNPTPWPEAKTPYERVHIDYLGPIRHKMYLIITCAYSKWPEVYQVNSLRATNWRKSYELVSPDGVYQNYLYQTMEDR
jgi:hypothetical protein